MYKPSQRSKVVLDKAQIAEIKEFYDGSFSSIRDLGNRFGVTAFRIEYIVNHKNFRHKVNMANNLWKEKNPVKARKANRKAKKLYYLRNRKKLNDYQREYKRKHRASKRVYDRIRYLKLKILNQKSPVQRVSAKKRSTGKK